MIESYYGLIDYKLLFSTYKEFKEKKRVIYENYVKMSVQEKVIYRMYVYSRPILTDKQKDYLWEEMNNYFRLVEDAKEINHEKEKTNRNIKYTPRRSTRKNKEFKKEIRRWKEEN